MEQFEDAFVSIYGESYLRLQLKSLTAPVIYHHVSSFTTNDLTTLPSVRYPCVSHQSRCARFPSPLLKHVPKERVTLPIKSSISLPFHIKSASVASGNQRWNRDLMPHFSLAPCSTKVLNGEGLCHIQDNTWWLVISVNYKVL
jgi:hypothetical protein